MVDARDLKSLGSNFPCRFKSGRPHQEFWPAFLARTRNLAISDILMKLNAMAQRAIVRSATKRCDIARRRPCAPSRRYRAGRASRTGGAPNCRWRAARTISTPCVSNIIAGCDRAPSRLTQPTNQTNSRTVWRIYRCQVFVVIFVCAYLCVWMLGIIMPAL
jgi:hypothetical protein